MIIEKQIIEQCKKGESKAQRFVFENFSPLMLGLCLRYVKDKNIAEDIMQEAFITIFSKIGQFKGIGSFEGWMKRIMINTALSYLRNRNREPAKLNFDTLYDFAEEDELNDTETAADEEINSDTDFSQQEIFAAIAELPLGFRTVFNLYALDGFKHREIAEILKINIGTSKSQLVRARKRVQENLIKIARNRISEGNKKGKSD